MILTHLCLFSFLAGGSDANVGPVVNNSWRLLVLGIGT